MQLTQIYYQRNLLFQEKYEAMIFYGAERLTVNSTMRHFCMCRGIFVRSQSAGMTWLVVSWPRHGGVSVDPDSVTNRHPLTLTHATRCYLADTDFDAKRSRTSQLAYGIEWRLQ